MQRSSPPRARRRDSRIYPAIAASQRPARMRLAGVRGTNGLGSDGPGYDGPSCGLCYSARAVSGASPRHTLSTCAGAGPARRKAWPIALS